MIKERKDMELFCDRVPTLVSYLLAPTSKEWATRCDQGMPEKLECSNVLGEVLLHNGWDNRCKLLPRLALMK